MSSLAFGVTDWVWTTTTAAEATLQCAGENVERSHASSAVLKLPAAERRRLNPLASFALRATERLAGNRGAELLASLPLVYGSGDGDGAVLLKLLAALRDRQPLSPTQFHNSVHNAAAGYWSIGLESQAPTTALAAGIDTIEVALAEAGLQAALRGGPVLMVAARRAFPAELLAARPQSDDFALAAWCVPAQDSNAWQCRLTPAAEATGAAQGTLEASIRQLGAKGLSSCRWVPRLAAVLQISRENH
jgi:hypothetical protein